MKIALYVMDNMIFGFYESNYPNMTTFGGKAGSITTKFMNY